MDWTIIAACIPMTVGAAWISWVVWFKPNFTDDENYGDLEYLPKPDVVTVDRMETLMVGITEYVKLVENPEAIEIEYELDFDGDLHYSLRNDRYSIFEYEDDQRKQIIMLARAKLWKLADEITAEGRFYVKQIEPLLFNSTQREALNQVWANIVVESDSYQGQGDEFTKMGNKKRMGM